MLIAGTLSGAEWGEAQSLARAIEDAMVAAGSLDLDAETEDATAERRKTFIAIATGIVTHFRSHARVTIPAQALGAIPAQGTQYPVAAVALDGRVS